MGKISYMRISPDDISEKKIDFPSTKEEMERFILERFVEQTNRQNTFLKFNSYKQNEQDDFDFSVKTSVGDKDIDLMEIAVLKNRGYDSVSKQYDDLNFSKEILKKNNKKVKQIW